MKNKRIILAVISIILTVILTTVSFAQNNTRIGMTFEEAVEASKERNNTVEKEMTTSSNENVTKNEEKPVENNVSTEKEETADIEDSSVEDEATSSEMEVEDIFKNETTEIEEEGIVSFKSTISEDLVEAGENIEYEAICVDGNAHIMAEKVILEDFKVNGNLFIMSTNVELKNVIIEGSVYIASENVKVDGQVGSAYIFSNNVTIESKANIIKELRVIASNLEIEGVVGRDLYGYSEKLKITDRAVIYGDCIVETTDSEVSEDAKIVGEKKIEIVENTNANFVVNKQQIYSSIIVECVIILIVAVFILYSSPKFVGVNSVLKMRDFIKAFFTGLLELILVFLLFLGLTYIGYGVGFGFALLILSFVLVYFGKMIFVISAGIRLSRKKENVSEIKAFLGILFILVIVEAISLLELTNGIGLLISLVVDLILGITGFGSLVRVVLTPTRKKKQVKTVKNTAVNNNTNNVNIREVRPDDFVLKGVPVEVKSEPVIEEKEEVVEKEEEKIEDIPQVETETPIVEEEIKEENEEKEDK